MMHASVVLSGPPGAGKTTIGRLAADRLGAPFVDLDQRIEADTGRAPGRLIREDGEAAFRRAEADTLARLAPGPCVLALGGGTLTTPEGRRGARERGPVVGLVAPEATLRDRHGTVDRPLSDEGLSTLLQTRALDYASVDVELEAEASPDAVADRVADLARSVHFLEAQVGERRSRVLIGDDLSRAPAGAVASLRPTAPVLVVVDEGIPEAARARIVGPIEAVARTVVHPVPGGEPVKTFAVLEETLAAALAAGCSRQSVVVGIGGGATCDLTGLVAALLGRGAPLVLVPSTLLAQVDASVGGKCALNMAAGRNLVGAFHPAEDVLADVSLLASLSDGEHRSGLAELAKMAILGDAGLFDALVRDGAATSARIARSIALKAEIVREDPFEHDRRRLLNLGHTLGHALEAASEYRLKHGEAVAVGTAAVVRFGRARGWTAPDDAARILKGLETLGLPTVADRSLLARAEPFIGADKKRTGGTVGLVVVRRLAEVTVETISLEEAQRGLIRHGENT